MKPQAGGVDFARSLKLLYIIIYCQLIFQRIYETFPPYTMLQIIPAEEHAAKIASARDAIGDSDFVLVARTDARATSAKTGLSDAISRANLYMEVSILHSHSLS